MSLSTLYSNTLKTVVLLLVLFCTQIQAQHSNTVNASLDSTCNEIAIQQEFSYTNTSKDTLTMLYFNDWANAYLSKNSALAKRLAEEFKKNLHLAKPKERGYTTIISIVDNKHQGLVWERLKGKDILKFNLNRPLLPAAKITLFITYKVQLPPNKYTLFGYDAKGNYYLRDWYLTPASYTNNWQLYSNKNLEDLQTDITNTTINFTHSKDVFITSNLDKTIEINGKTNKTTTFEGKNRKSGEIIIKKNDKFITHITPDLTIETNFTASKYDEILQSVSLNKVASFIKDNLGAYPHKKVLVSELEYSKKPLYGTSQLPSFIVPYPEEFRYELKLLKTTLYKVLEESLYLNPRKEKWVTDAIAIYLMIKYVDTYYPNQKLLGKLSNLWGVRSFEIAKMNFNDQYVLLSMLTTRKNLGQPLTTPNDSLIKFNQRIANSYKSGLGLAYLSEYIGYDKVANSIKKFYKAYKSLPVEAIDFESILKKSTDKNIDWFFDEYIATNEKIDFKIKKIIKLPDSLKVIIKNKSASNVPISLFGLRKDSVVSKYWIADIKGTTTFTIPRNGEDKLVLNYDKKIPEFNQRDNWKSLKGFFSSNKKLKFQFFKDAENPYYNQVFYMPNLRFNAYDGFIPSLSFHNKVLLERPFLFSFSPAYSTKQKSLVGSGRISIRNYHKNRNLFLSTYSLSASTYHFAKNSRYTSISPSFGLGWRPKNLRSNRYKYFFMRYVNIFRKVDKNLNLATDPDYSVLNARYIDSNNGVIDYLKWFTDVQYSNKFSKISFNLDYRKLFQNNRQFNFRFYAGKFLNNNTDSDYFSFALDRPTDYLFEYNYLGRSDAVGFYSQQIVIAEGGFKSKLKSPYANDWLATINTSTNIWRWIEAYGDIGYIKNKGANARFVYDAGIRLNLVSDYFELFLPMYSNNGWEVSQPNYGEKIRFMVTLSPRALTGLFTRKWF